MRKLLLILSLIPVFALSGQPAEIPKIDRKVVAEEIRVGKITPQDIEATILHMLRNNEAQGRALKSSQDEVTKLKTELLGEKAAHESAQLNADKLQKENDDLAKWANKQSDNAKYWNEKHGEAVKKLWWWRIWFGGAAFLGIGSIIFMLLMRYTTWGATKLAPLVTKSFIP